MTWSRKTRAWSALLGILLLVLIVVLWGNQRQVHAQIPPPNLGSIIVCLVFTELNNIGDPLPILGTNDCPGAPTLPTTGTLKVVKNVVGGDASPSDFLIHVSKDDTELRGSPKPGNSVRGTSYISVMPGEYTVEESGGPPHYAVAFGGACGGNGVVTVISSSTVTCTITNTFQELPPDNGNGDNGDNGDNGNGDNGGDNGNGDNGNGGNGDGNGDGGTTPPPSGGGSGSVSQGGGGGGGSAIATQYSDLNPPGQVLGEAVVAPLACPQYLHGFIRFGVANDLLEVQKLQLFLNVFEGNSLMITGVYDNATHAAVHTFQKKYEADILTPWRATESTGYVYLTTRKKINEIYCNRPFPLTAGEQRIIETTPSTTVVWMPSAQSPTSAANGTEAPPVEESETERATTTEEEAPVSALALTLADAGREYWWLILLSLAALVGGWYYFALPKP